MKYIHDIKAELRGTQLNLIYLKFFWERLWIMSDRHLRFRRQ